MKGASLRKLLEKGNSSSGWKQKVVVKPDMEPAVPVLRLNRKSQKHSHPVRSKII